MEICGIYKITNAITGDFYIGSSKDVKRRWASHKWKSSWNDYPNNQLYLDMKRYGTDNFVLEILEEVEIDKLKEMEQHYIETLKPTYNNYNAKGWDIERRKETNRKYDNKYNNQLCIYNGETLTLRALSMRFWRAGIPHPVLEAKKYLL